MVEFDETLILVSNSINNGNLQLQYWLLTRLLPELNSKTCPTGTNSQKLEQIFPNHPDSKPDMRKKLENSC